MPPARRTRYGPEVQVSCHMCRREVPLSEALSADVRDYVVFFCSQPCFDRWFEQTGERDPNDRESERMESDDTETTADRDETSKKDG